VTDQYAGAGSVEHQSGSRDVGLKGGLGLLNDVDGEAIVPQEVCDGLPSGTVGECAMDKYDILDRGVTGGGYQHTE
jgi:hypothetical protein